MTNRDDYPMLCARCNSPLNDANAMEVPITEHGVPIPDIATLVCVGCFPLGPLERDWRMDEAIDEVGDDG